MFKTLSTFMIVAACEAVRITQEEHNHDPALEFIKQHGFDVKEGASEEEAERAADRAMMLMDGDRDGLVKAEEAPEVLQPYIALHDTDGDMALNRNEMKGLAMEYGIHITPEQFLQDHGFVTGDESAHDSEFENAASRGFGMMDQNKDGMLTTEEIPDELETDGMAFDQNKDGAISYKELVEIAKTFKITIDKTAFMNDAGFHIGDEKISGKQAAAAAERGFCLMNKNKDKWVQMDEVPKELLEFAEAGDKNGDGKIAMWELKRIAKEHKITVNDAAEEAAAAKMVQEAGFTFVEEDVSEEDAKRAAAKAMQVLDPNGDGAIEKKELPCDLYRYFDAADANKDGKVDQKEMEGVSKAHKIKAN